MNKEIVRLKYISYKKRFLPEMFNAGGISLMLILLVLGLTVPFHFFHIFFITLYFAYAVLWILLARIYVIDVSENGDEVTINYLVRDEMNSVTIPRINLTVQFSGGGLGEPRGKRLVFKNSGKTVLTQYSIGEWDTRTMERVYNLLKAS